MSLKRKFEDAVGSTHSGKKRRSTASHHQVPPSLKWLYRSRGSDLEAFDSTGPVSSLQNQATRCLIRNLHLLSIDDLEHMPNHLLETLVERLHTSDLMSARALQLLGLNTKSSTLSHNLKTVHVEMPATVIDNNFTRSLGLMDSFQLRDVIKHLDFDPGKCLASVHVVLHPVESSDLQLLGSMQNLSTLTLQGCGAHATSGAMRDGLARQMSQLRSEAMCFPVLTALVVMDFMGQWSPTFLQNLLEITSLQVVCLRPIGRHGQVEPSACTFQYAVNTPGWLRRSAREFFAPGYTGCTCSNIGNQFKDSNDCTCGTGKKYPQLQGLSNHLTLHQSILPCCSTTMQAEFKDMPFSTPQVHAYVGANPYLEVTLDQYPQSLEVFIRDKDYVPPAKSALSQRANHQKSLAPKLRAGRTGKAFLDMLD